ncbi:MAG: sigma-54-dependent transcriptional regulator [Pseudohaliea sp.]
MTTASRVLLVEDSESMASIYRGYLASSAYQVETAASIGEARQALEKQPVAIVLLDVKLPDGNGLDFVDELLAREDAPDIVVMTAYATADMAVQAVRRGAVDFITKPFDATRLLVTLDNTLAQQQLRRDCARLSRRRSIAFDQFVGDSPAMHSVYQTIEALAASDAAVFVVGESGTGKELAARAIHDNSERVAAGFVILNCGAMPSDRLDLALFGSEGAARRADGGTLFLDEVCELEPELQAKLLRFVQFGTFLGSGPGEEQVDARIICATNRDPLRAVQDGTLREDLYYRLHVVPLRMPPLRERGGDIALLAAHYLARFASESGKRFRGFSENAMEALQRYPWPGNVRQLQNVLREIVVLHDAGQVTEAMLPDFLQSGHIPVEPPAPPSAARSEVPAAARDVVEPLWLLERRAIEEAIAACDGNVNRAAGLLEVAPSTVYRKLQAWKQSGDRG